MKREPLTTGQVAEYCHVTVRAVLKWVSEGKLKAYRTPGKHSRVKVADFIDFLIKYNMPIPAELQITSSKKKVLIVDDDKKVVELIRKMLEMDKRYEIKVAFDGFSAGHKFSQLKPDLVILDIKMPGLDGYEVCAQIRSNPANKGVKILAVSGVIEEEGPEQILKAGANDYMAKPFDTDSLKRKVGKLLGVKPEKKQKGSEIKEEDHE